MSDQSKVYVVVIFWTYDTELDKVAVFSSYAEADAFREKYIAESHSCAGDMYDIIECKVGQQ